MMEVDEVSELITAEEIEAIKIRSKSSFDDAIEELLQLEKKYRTGGDAISLGKVLVAIVQLLFENARFEELNENILIFAMKKHLQSEQAIGEMIRECCKFSNMMQNLEDRVKLLETLKTVTNGKLYSEIERAKICKDLAEIRKSEGELSQAISILEDLKIDTLTSLDRKERIEIILQSMELLIDTKDFIKCLIIAKKINKQHLDQTPEYEQLKLKFYKLMIVIDKDENYLNTSRHYQAILNSSSVECDPLERRRVLSLATIYCVLSPFDIEKFDMMQRLLKNKLIEEIQLRQLLKEFTTVELINWYEMKAKFKEELTSLGIFDVNTQEGLKCWKDLRTATIEHNIKVFATYYQRIHLSHMSEFLDINTDETEKHLSKLIVNKSIKAKIDRPSGIVTFSQKQCTTDFGQKLTGVQQENLLKDWLEQVSSLMRVIDNTTHLINKDMEL